MTGQLPAPPNPSLSSDQWLTDSLLARPTKYWIRVMTTTAPPAAYPVVGLKWNMPLEEFHERNSNQLRYRDGVLSGRK